MTAKTILPAVVNDDNSVSRHPCKYDATIGSLVAIVEAMKEGQNKLFPKIDTLGTDLVNMSHQHMNSVNDLKLEIQKLISCSKTQAQQNVDVKNGLDLVKQSMLEINDRLTKSETKLSKTVEDIESMSGRVGVMESQSTKVVGAFVIIPVLLSVVSIVVVVYEIITSVIK